MDLSLGWTGPGEEVCAESGGGWAGRFWATLEDPLGLCVLLKPCFQESTGFKEVLSEKNDQHQLTGKPKSRVHH